MPITVGIPVCHIMRINCACPSIWKPLWLVLVIQPIHHYVISYDLCFSINSSYLSPYFSRLRCSRAAARLAFSWKYVFFSSSVIFSKSTSSESVVASLSSKTAFGSFSFFFFPPMAPFPPVFFGLSFLTLIFPPFPSDTSVYTLFEIVIVLLTITD